MEGSNSLELDHDNIITRIAANGNKPDDWKNFIDNKVKMKMRTESWDEIRQYRMLSYLFLKALKLIPEGDCSLSHAQLLLEYVELCSSQSLAEAAKMLAYGRSILPMFAIIHVASAELELKRGNKHKALALLQKASTSKAEPETLIAVAKQRLREGKTNLRADDPHELSSEWSSPTSGNECSGEVNSSQLSGIVSDIGHVEVCMPTTQEVQHDLHMLVSVPVPKTDQRLGHLQPPHASSLPGPPSFSTNQTYVQHQRTSSLPGPPNANASHPGTLHSILDPPQGCSQQRAAESPPGQPVNDLDNGHLRTPEPPQLCMSRYSYLLQPNESIKRLLVSISRPAPAVPETPLNKNLGLGSHQSSNTKKLLDFTSTPKVACNVDAPQNVSVMSVRKQMLNLGPPQRVKVTQRRLLEEDHEDMDDMEAVDTKDTSASNLETVQSKSSVTTAESTLEKIIEEPSQTTFKDLSSARTEISMGTLKDLSNTRFAKIVTSENNFQSNFFSEKRESSLRSNYIPCPEPPYQNKNSKLTYVHPNREPLNREKFISCEDYMQNEIMSAQKVLPGINTDTVRKAEPFTPSVFKDKNADVPPTDLARLSSCSHPPNRQNAEQNRLFSREAIDHQQHANQVRGYVQQQSESSQQKSTAEEQQGYLQPHLQFQPVVNKTFSMPNPIVSCPNNFMQTSLPQQPASKTFVVNGKQYLVVSFIARGGSAKVYRVLEPNTNMYRALKCVNLSCANEAILQGYKNEINLLKKLQHCDRVIKLYDYEYLESSKKLYVVMECGETDLCKFISQTGNNAKALHPIIVRFYWLQMVTAVHAMHCEGVIHSDLKPANFILVSGEVKLIDFGIANALQQECTSVLKESSVGTPNYMSPEQLMVSNAYHSDSKNKYKVGVRSDVWSLGCILYQMVYGHTPFQFVRHKVEAISNPNHEIPFPDVGDPALMDVLKKCLTRNVQERPTTKEILNHPYLQG